MLRLVDIDSLFSVISSLKLPFLSTPRLLPSPGSFPLAFLASTLQ